MDWSFTSDNDRKIALQRGGIGKYRLTLKGEMQTYNMKVKNTVCTDFLLRMKDISTSDVVINIMRPLQNLPPSQFSPIHS